MLAQVGAAGNTTDCQCGEAISKQEDIGHLTQDAQLLSMSEFSECRQI